LITPKDSTIIHDNITKYHTVAPIYVYAHANMSVCNNKFLGTSVVTFNSGIDQAISDGAELRGPPFYQ
jgi:hypothetical protein